MVEGWERSWGGDCEWHRRDSEVLVESLSFGILFDLRKLMFRG